MNPGSHNAISGTTLIGVICVLCMMIAPFGVLADEEPPSSTEDTQLLSAFDNEARLSTDQLEDQRARANIEVHKVTINDQELNGVVSNNTAIGNETGDNIIADGAFTDAAGFIGTVQNSGNNVLIQNSTIINVAVEP